MISHDVSITKDQYDVYIDVAKDYPKVCVERRNTLGDGVEYVYYWHDGAKSGVEDFLAKCDEALIEKRLQGFDDGYDKALEEINRNGPPSIDF